MGALTLTRVTLAMLRLSLLHLRKRWSEAKIRRLRRLRLLASTGDRLQGGVLRLHALDAMPFRMCVGADGALSCHMSAFMYAYAMCETLILRWLHASQIPQLSDLDFFSRSPQGKKVNETPIFLDKKTLYSHYYTSREIDYTSRGLPSAKHFITHIQKSLINRAYIDMKRRVSVYNGH